VVEYEWSSNRTTNVEEARQEAQKMSDAFAILTEEQKKSKAEWKRIQTRLMADVESTAEENGRLKQAVESLTAETTKLKKEKEVAVQRARQIQEELGPLKMEPPSTNPINYPWLLAIHKNTSPLLRKWRISEASLLHWSWRINDCLKTYRRFLLRSNKYTKNLHEGFNNWSRQ
jgi:hypothetical protein